MKQIKTFIRRKSLKVLAVLFSIFIFIYFLISSFFKWVFPAFIPSTFISETTRKLKCTIPKNAQSEKSALQAYKLIQIIIDSMLSLVLVLFIADYSGKMINIVEIISREAHEQFISLIFPGFPQISTYIPYHYISKIYVYTGYLGFTAQLALTIDFIKLFNLPTILIYKGLAFVYHYVLQAMRFSLKIIKHDPEYWLTCESQEDERIKKNWNWLSILAYGSILVIAQTLIFVGFYYIWLSVVIIVLLLVIVNCVDTQNSIKNMISLIDLISPVLFILKGYGFQIFPHKRDSTTVQFLCYFIKDRADFISPLKPQDAKDIIFGNDILKFIKSNHQETTINFSNFKIKAIYHQLLQVQNKQK